MRKADAIRLITPIWWRTGIRSGRVGGSISQMHSNPMAHDGTGRQDDRAMTLRRVFIDDPVVAPLLAGLAAEYGTRCGGAGAVTAVGQAGFRTPAGPLVVAVGR